MTTLELGGNARFFAEATTEAQALQALRWAADNDVSAFVIGGGSNLVVGDEGVDGLVLSVRLRGLRFRPRDSGIFDLLVQAGEPWDAVVESSVRRELAGLECMSGIPGLAGATPIQNVGAYGQEVADVVESVRAVDRNTLESCELGPSECEFSYRSSAFKRAPDRWLVTAVAFRLQHGAAPTLRYPELARAVASRGAGSLGETRQEVLRLRRSKSMVLDPGDPNRRSAGSFFTNPIVTAHEADRICALAVERGLVNDPADVPRYVADEGHAKLAAAWLIERAGVSRGYRRGPVGVSSRHTLALVHHGGGTTRALLSLAAEIRARVFETWGVLLHPEPVLLGAVMPDAPTGS